MNNRKTLFSQQDEEELLNELPNSLREEILYHQYGQLVEQTRMLWKIQDNEFIMAFIQHAK
jgi:hypothetical protein